MAGETGLQGECYCSGQASGRWISTTFIFCYKGFLSGKCHTFVKTETLEKSKLY